MICLFVTYRSFLDLLYFCLIVHLKLKTFSHEKIITVVQYASFIAECLNEANILFQQNKKVQIQRLGPFV